MHLLVLGQGHQGVHNFKLQLCISLDYKSLSHGKSKASKMECYILLFKAGSKKELKYTVG